MTNSFFYKNIIGDFSLISSLGMFLDEDEIWYGIGRVSLHFDGWYLLKIDVDGLLCQGDIEDDRLDLDSSCIKITGIDDI
jgi:hypothetical protein